MITITPTTITGTHVILAPLTFAHESALAAISSDPEIWQYLPIPLNTRENVHAWLTQALANAESGTELPFVILDRASGAAIGSTRFMDIRPEHDAVEIGYTWLGKDWWRTPVNTECKYLLLRHLIEDVGCVRVSLKTDMHNVRSQNAIARLGAVREGVLRKHMLVQNGRRRDTVYFSILDDEWRAVKAGLEVKLRS